MIKTIDFNCNHHVHKLEVKRVGKQIYWGNDNKFPQYVYNTINNSPLLHSILKGSIDFTLGDNFTDSTGFVSKLVTDRWYFGGFCIQVLRNSVGRVVKLEYIDIRFCRLSSNGERVYVHDPETFKVMYDLPTYNPAKRDLTSIYFYSGLTNKEIYPVPEFSTSLLYAEMQGKIADFHFNTLNNNFNVSAIINLNNGGYTQEVADEYERKLSRKFGGTENAGKFMLVLNDSAANAATVERLQSDDFDSKYEALQSACERNIFTSLRAMPQLFGINFDTVFSTQDYDNAYKLYYRTAVKPKQDEIINVLSEFNVEQQFNPFTL